MKMNRTHREHRAKGQPYAGMRGLCVSVSLSLMPGNTFGIGLGQGEEQSIDNRQFRH